MSSFTVSTGLSPAFVPASRRNSRPVNQRSARTAVLRLTRRGRIVLVLTFLAIAAALMTAFGGLATATHDAGTPEPVRVVEVGPGDTLYGIAGQIAQPGKVRDMVQHIEELNSLTGPELTVGQRLAVPKG